MGRHLVLAGCGHAHLAVLVEIRRFIRRGHRITAINPSPYLYYSGMGSGLLSGTYRPEEVRFHVQKTAQDRGANFVPGKITRVDPVSRLLYLESGETIPYDVVSFNTGSYVPSEELGGRDGSAFSVKPIEQFAEARLRLIDLCRTPPVRICVIGGGAAGVEAAGNAWRAAKECGNAFEVRIFSRGLLLEHFPPRARRLTLRSFESRGIRVEEGVQIVHVSPDYCVTREGRKVPCDMAFIASGIRPSPVFRLSNLPTDKQGSLLVNPNLQSVAHPEIFGAGDCIAMESRFLDKVGVYAVREGPILASNLLAALENAPLSTFHPQRSFQLIINLGDGRAITCRKSLAWDGKLSYRLKDRIDRRFMRRFQVSGETAGMD